MPHNTNSELPKSSQQEQRPTRKHFTPLPSKDTPCRLMLKEVRHKPQSLILRGLAQTTQVLLNENHVPGDVYRYDYDPEKSQPPGTRCIENLNKLVEKVSIAEEDCIVGVMEMKKKYPNAHICLLNMANRNTVLGATFQGAMAQEEHLAVTTDLAPSLIDYAIKTGSTNINASMEYKNSRDNTNPDNAFGIHATLSSQNQVIATRNGDDYVMLPEEDRIDVTIISSAAIPGASRTQEKGYEGMYKIIYTQVMAALIEMQDAKEKIFIPSAHGCGAFRNDPEWIANIYKEVLSLPEFVDAFDKIHFSIYDKNVNQFIKVFSEENFALHYACHDKLEFEYEKTEASTQPTPTRTQSEEIIESIINEGPPQHSLPPIPESESKDTPLQPNNFPDELDLDEQSVTTTEPASSKEDTSKTDSYTDSADTSSTHDKEPEKQMSAYEERQAIRKALSRNSKQAKPWTRIDEFSPIPSYEIIPEETLTDPQSLARAEYLSIRAAYFMNYENALVKNPNSDMRQKLKEQDYTHRAFDFQREIMAIKHDRKRPNSRTQSLFHNADASDFKVTETTEEALEVLAFKAKYFEKCSDHMLFKKPKNPLSMNFRQKLKAGEVNTMAQIQREQEHDKLIGKVLENRR